ncbi:WD40 repeat-like protein, partial [Linderina pennispora]
MSPEAAAATAAGIDAVGSEELHGPAKKIRIDGPKSEEPEQKPLTQEHIFHNLRLRRIVRENHSSTIAQLALYFYRPNDLTPLDAMECDGHHKGHGLGGLSHYERKFDKRGAVLRENNDNSNLLGTVGATQANIYDNENQGDHLDIMSHYQLPEESALPLHTCCWVHTPDDALLAMGGEDKLVHIISLGWSREIRVLRGHTGAVIDLQMHPTNQRLLVSAGKDRTVRIWSVQTGECLCRYETDATAVRFHPDGKSLLTGSSQGEIRQWPVP